MSSIPLIATNACLLIPAINPKHNFYQKPRFEPAINGLAANSRFPATAQRAIKGHRVEQPLRLECHNILLRDIKVLLRQENSQVAVNALTVSRIAQIKTLLLHLQP